MGLNDLGLVNGLTASLVVITGILLGIYLIVKSQETKSEQILGFGLFIFFSCFSWSAVAINFLLGLLEKSYLDSSTYLYLIAWSAALSFIPISYVTFSLLLQKYLTIGMLISILLSLVFLAIVYILVPAGILKTEDVFDVSTPTGGTIPDSSYQGMARILVVILIIIVLFLGISFLLVIFMSEIRYVKVRGLFIGLGLLLYATMAFIDGLVDNSDTIMLLVVRISLVLSMILNTIGITMPKFITNLFNAGNQN